MPERLHRLHDTLRELEEELRRMEDVDPETVDPETQQVLREAIDEIHIALDKQDASHLKRSGVMGRLRDSVDRFELSHPTLSSVASRVAEALGQLGI